MEKSNNKLTKEQIHRIIQKKEKSIQDKKLIKK